MDSCVCMIPPLLKPEGCLTDHSCGLAGAAAGAQPPVQPAAASQVCHCQHRHLRGAQVCLGSGRKAAAAGSPHSRGQEGCLGG